MKDYKVRKVEKVLKVKKVWISGYKSSGFWLLDSEFSKKFPFHYAKNIFNFATD